MTKNSKVTVIMAVFNDEARVKNSIESILGQTYQNIELLILDDNSSDKTFDICDSYSNESNVNVFRNTKNIGLTKSLNKLIEMSDCDFIARQDSDDISYPTRIEKQLDFMDVNKVLVSTTRAHINNQSRKKIRPRYSHYLSNKLVINLKNPFIHGTLLIDKALLKKIGGYDEHYYFAQDFKLFSSLINENIEIKTLNEPLYFLNTEDNLSTKYKSKQKKYSKEILRENRKLFLK